MRGRIRAAIVATVVVIPALVPAQSPQQAPPVPKPFPRPGEAAPPPVADPAALAQAGAQIGPDIGAPVYPGAEYLEAYEAGRGQRIHLYGTNVGFADIVKYYRTTMSNNGREVFREPGIHQFDLGRWDDDTMVLQPAVVVKDYTWNGSAGYLHVSGTTEQRFRTLIQIVPVK